MPAILIRQECALSLSECFALLPVTEPTGGRVDVVVPSLLPGFKAAWIDQHRDDLPASQEQAASRG
jgi:hypothetical protein